MEELIPGLPNDIGIECLIRIPFEKFSSFSSVCCSWKSELELPHFWKHRAASGFSQQLIVMVQARFDPTRNDGLNKYSGPPVYRLTVCEPRTGNWSELPPVPGYSDGLPMFCQIAGVGRRLVLMGGWEPATWKATSSVFVYNLVSGKWRRGADMPGSPRTFFACASDNDRRVLVAGGHDDDKTALNSGMVYDVERDVWTHLPDMSRGRDECKGVFHCGNFHVVGGYQTEKQGRFEKSAEVLDGENWKLVEDFLEFGGCPRTICSVDGGGDEERLYMCRSDEVVAVGTDQSSDQVIAALPAEVISSPYMVPSWDGKLMVMGATRIGEPAAAYVLDDLKNHHSRWTKVEKPREFAGHVQSHCCMKI